MELLKQRILKDGKVIGDDILKVDSFLNHQIDPALLYEMALELKRLFGGEGVNKIFTIEASGIALACMAGYVFSCPLVFAKKSRSRNISDDVYSAEVESFTHGKVYDIIVAREFLRPEDRVLLIDDFLANGSAMNALIDIVHQAGAEVVGAGIVIEKAFQPGGERIRGQGIRVESLARIASMSEETGVVFCD
mgnify:CR=1 FL=1